jgi:RNA polymerase sigma-70 factor (ECF subfamily)
MFRHARGLRALIRELVFDDHYVDDVLQETWLRAFVNPPRSEAALGVWLRRVAARVAYTTRRRARDRVRCELRAARDEEAPSVEEELDVALTREVVAEAVADLDEPYHSAIRERFFADLSAQEIAERHGLPVETVRTRIKRGLTHLRSRLEEVAPAAGAAPESFIHDSFTIRSRPPRADRGTRCAPG